MDVNRFKSLFHSTIDPSILIHIIERFDELKNRIQISGGEYKFNVLDNPFFLQPTSVNIPNAQTPDLDEFQKVYDNLPSDIVFNPWIMMAYLFSGSPNRAIIIKDWTIFSLSQAIERIIDRKKEHPEITWTDLGHRYMGMGHIQVLRMDLESGSLFTQYDGGSNCYDRDAYWKQYKDQKVSKSDTIEFIQFIMSE
jgi:hypothetical protein